ncbi:ATP-binding protein [Gibbsiella greigii]
MMMKGEQHIFKERRMYNQWVMNETLEDYALRFTANAARRWSLGRVMLTAVSSVTFLIMEVIGASLAINYGFHHLLWAMLLVCPLLFFLSLPISYYCARYGLDIDLLTRGAGFGYIGSTITSFIYACYTFIFLALESVIMAVALQMLFAIPPYLSYLLSTLVIIPLVAYGFTFISRFQRTTQLVWVILQLLPFIFIIARETNHMDMWLGFPGTHSEDNASFDMMKFGAAASILFSLLAQIGEQVDLLRFMPRKDPHKPLRWWCCLIFAGPGWIFIGAVKVLLGAFLGILVLQHGLSASDAINPTHMYLTAFSYVTQSPPLMLALTGIFIVLSQLKINVVNAYAGSIAWSNFFLRLTHRHPGRVVWIFFNVALALLLIVLNIYQAIENILGIYAIVAVSWLGTIVADLIINRPLGLSPPGIEFRRAHLYDLNPVGLGSMFFSFACGLFAYLGGFGEVVQTFSSFLALLMTFLLTPLLAWWTKGRFYIADHAGPETTAALCSVCNHTYEREEMSYCPFYQGAICSLCCSLDVRCGDRCKTHSHYREQIKKLLGNILPSAIMQHMDRSIWSFLSIMIMFSLVIAGLLLLIFFQMIWQYPLLDGVIATVLLKTFCILTIVIGVSAWLFLLTSKSRQIARQELDMQTERLMQEIDAHEETARQLQEAKETADYANKAKSRYLTGISHELRTPLNALLGYAQLLEDSEDIPAPRRPMVQVIRHSGEHLANLIEGLLDISRIEAGRFEIFISEVRIADFMAQLVELFSHQAAKKGLRFIYQAPAWLPEWVKTDEKRLRQILINLLSNAIKFTDSGAVTLEFRYRGEIAYFSVIDTGVGIDSAYLTRIFKPFERIPQTAQRQPGTGLGLTITQQLAYIMGGDLQVTSELGKGSTFTLQLMLSQTNKNLLLAEKQHHAGVNGAGYTVIIVDDNEIQSRLIVDLLSPLDFKVMMANSGQQCLRLCQQHTPDLFLLDVTMPGMSGWELLTTLRQRGFSQPVIMISAEPEGNNEKQHEKFVRGASSSVRYMTKPIRRTLLVDHIGALLEISSGAERMTDMSPVLAPAPTVDDTRYYCKLSNIEKRLLIEMANLGYAPGIKALLDRLATEEKISPLGYERLYGYLQRFSFECFITELDEMNVHE